MDKLMEGTFPARERLESLFDRGSFVELDPYANSGRQENDAQGVITGYGAVGGRLVFAFSQNAAVYSGAVGRAQANKIGRLYDLASKAGAPVTAIYDSCGAKLDEGNEPLTAYGEIIGRISSLSGVVPQISLVMGVCSGAAALAACCSDIVIAVRGSELYLTQPDFNGSGKAAGLSAVHILAETDKEALEAAGKLLKMLPANNLDSPVRAPGGEINRESPVLREISDFDDKSGRIDDILKEIFDHGSFLELKKSSAPGADNVLTGIASLGGKTVGVIAVSGRICAQGSRKICGIVRFCDSFGIPLVTLSDAAGFELQQDGLTEAAALSCALAEATVPKVALVIGRSYGSAYVALSGKSSSDFTLAWPSALIGTLPAETAVAFLWTEKLRQMQNPPEDRKKLEDEYTRTLLSAEAAAQSGLIDDIIDPSETRARLFSALDMLAGKRILHYPRKHTDMPF